jgi:hypothetical protein
MAHPVDSMTAAAYVLPCLNPLPEPETDVTYHRLSPWEPGLAWEPLPSSPALGPGQLVQELLQSPVPNHTHAHWSLGGMGEVIAFCGGHASFHCYHLLRIN